jgi:hypothetical protein
MITPAISVLSAIEGLQIATPVFTPYVVAAALLVNWRDFRLGLLRAPKVRFATDSPLEGDGFEPSVPGDTPWVPSWKCR